MRVRVWLAESSSSARRGQNSLGRVEKNNQWFFIWNNPWMPVSVFSFTNPSIWCYFVHTLLSCHACTSVLYPITSGAYDLLDITLLWHYFLFLPFFNPSFLLCLFHFCAHAFMLPVFLINVCYIFLFFYFCVKFQWLCGLRVARDVGVIQLPCVVLWLALLFFYHVNVKLKKIHISQNGGVAV